MKLSLKKMIIFFIIFLYIYMPPIFPHSAIVWTFFFGVICLLNLSYMQKSFTHRVIKKWGIAAGIFVLAFISSSHIYGLGNSIKILADKFLMLIYIPLGVTAIVIYFRKLNYKRLEVWTLLIQVALAQACLDILAYLIKPVQNVCCFFLRNIMSVDEIIWWKEYRLYGLSASLTYAMPVAQALLGGVCFLYASKYNSKYFIGVPVIWLSSIINARVGVIVILVEVIVWIIGRLSILYGRKLSKSLFLVYLGTGLAIVFLILAIVLGTVKLSNRLTDPIEELLSVIAGTYTAKTNGYFSYFYSSKDVFAIPSGVSMFIGGGILNDKADVGYIIHLWMGGIIFCILLYLFYLRILKEWHSSIEKEMRFIVWTFGLVLFIVNLKGDAFASIGEFTNLFFLATGMTAYYKYCEDGIQEI